MKEIHSFMFFSKNIYIKYYTNDHYLTLIKVSSLTQSLLYPVHLFFYEKNGCVNDTDDDNELNFPVNDAMYENERRNQMEEYFWEAYK